MKQKLFFGIGSLVIITAVIAGTNYFDRKSAGGDAPTSSSFYTPGSSFSTLGTVDCLPHKDSSGPQTLECAIGIKVENQGYYALSDLPQSVTLSNVLITGSKVRVNGIVQLPTASERYDVVGIISVDSIAN